MEFGCQMLFGTPLAWARSMLHPPRPLHEAAWRESFSRAASAPIKPTSRKPTGPTARTLRKSFSRLSGALKPQQTPGRGPRPSGRPPLRHRDDLLPRRCSPPQSGRAPSPRSPFLTRGRRATACWTRSFTARSANPTPSSADMPPALHIPRGQT